MDLAEKFKNWLIEEEEMAPMTAYAYSGPSLRYLRDVLKGAETRKIKFPIIGWEGGYDLFALDEEQVGELERRIDGHMDALRGIEADDEQRREEARLERVKLNNARSAFRKLYREFLPSIEKKEAQDHNIRSDGSELIGIKLFYEINYKGSVYKLSADGDNLDILFKDESGKDQQIQLPLSVINKISLLK